MTAAGSSPALAPGDRAERPLVGASTAVLDDPGMVAQLCELGLECLEIRACDGARWPALADELSRLAVPFGLHCPVPFDRQLTEFEITGPDPRARATALRLVHDTVRTAAAVGADWVTVHFPSARPRMTRYVPEAGGADRIEDAAAELSALARSTGIEILLENMSYHPRFGSAADYAGLLGRHPGLGLCLDAGHAHLSAHAGSAVDFAERLRPWIRCAHLYDCNPRATEPGRHLPPQPGRDPAAGWLDLPALLAVLAGGGTGPCRLLLEYDAPDRPLPTAAEALTVLRGWAAG